MPLQMPLPSNDWGSLPNSGPASTPNASGSLAHHPTSSAASPNVTPAVASPHSHTPQPRFSHPPPYQQGSPNQDSQKAPPLQSHMSPPPSQQTHQSPMPPELNGFQPSQNSQIPAHGHPPPQPTATGLGSPSSASPAVPFSREYIEMADMIKKTQPDVVRHVIRDHWERALLGSQYHIAFILNATMHQANNETLRRAVQDFGERMIKESKQHVIRHLSAEDFDEMADLLLARVTNKFLDKAFARRLETIPARELVNALARAERLGYDVQDIVEERGPGDEHVIPSIVPQAYPSSEQQAPFAMHQSSLPPLASQGPLIQPMMTQQVPTQAATQYQTPSIGRPPKSWARKWAPIQGPEGSLYCSSCYWPCAGPDALEYHSKKSACNKWTERDRIGRELCPLCGCRFGSGGGLAYHLKTKVCGPYEKEFQNTMVRLIDDFRAWKRAQGPTPNGFPSLVEQSHVPMVNSNSPLPSHSRVATPQQVTSQAARGTPRTVSESDWVTPGNDPYSKLTPEQRQAFEQEMKDAEEYYGRLMRDALQLPPAEQESKLISLKNRYNTKQSVTRKKYGIRLRERRKRSQITAERSRLFGSADGPSLSGRDGPAPKKAKTSEAVSSTPTAAPGHQTESPRKRVPVSEMGGLTGSSATAETTDPTAFLTSSQPRHLQQASDAPTDEAQSNGATPVGGTQADPMAIDDDPDSDSDSDSDSDDEERNIPTSLPQ